MIEDLGPNQIFIFGSNTAGVHAGGAAFLAKEKFGAEDGIGEGLTGRCYAFPTLDYRLGIPMVRRSTEALKRSRDKLYATARALPEKQFLLTKVGCGIAGYKEADMQVLFVSAPENIVLPADWQEV
ncbi:MAG TPA: hypothetical protein VJ836_00630 [Candidatus Saccharimonadales bacterium]|nr:hypothetical protein [Candidatus Saccharimonadales bacterium]